ncbi:hypothetical protein RIU76_08455 [Latilactobacillus sakei subsp. sakei]|uniref:hypothetical protein n=1 Tax=Latilactobacillus TaxID=2767885 RepID=UPI00223B09DA|nr:MULTISPECIES: hypothetical protein [Latilactobacillus]MDR7924724.1 hypothetical protein [Latilactobacillus sakei subsp. sakei]
MDGKQNEVRKEEMNALMIRLKTAIFFYVLDLLEQKNSNPEVVAAIPKLLNIII